MYLIETNDLCKKYGDKYRSTIYGKVFRRSNDEQKYNYYTDDDV